ncbi:MAG: potassium channel family protein [Bacteroidota bacterium]|jgi:Ion channel
MQFTAKTREILKFLIVTIGIYTCLIFLFAILYYETGSIGFYRPIERVYEPIDFQKAIYFSIVSFHTIGYGDIYPLTASGRYILMTEAFSSLFFTSIFSGFLVYFVIRRRDDIFTTRFVYIRLRRDKWFLSIRLGNKGRSLIDMKGKFEAWIVQNNSRVRIFQYEEEMADMESILYYDIYLDNSDALKLRQALADSLNGKILLHVKYAFIGNDISTGEQLAHAVYYDSTKFRFGRMFDNVYSWDEHGRRVNFKWKNFEKIELLESHLQEEFIRG